jgi:hypothetical protein
VRNGKLIRFLAQERIREASQQRHLEGNREGLGHTELRRRDHTRREGPHDREEDLRNAREVQKRDIIRRLSGRFIPFPVELLGWGVEFGQEGIC